MIVKKEYTVYKYRIECNGCGVSCRESNTQNEAHWELREGWQSNGKGEHFCPVCKEKRINADRSRSYGLRIGDVVRFRLLGGNWGMRHKVVSLNPTDNNSVYLRAVGTLEEPFPMVAERCKIITKVEEEE